MNQNKTGYRTQFTNRWNENLRNIRESCFLTMNEEFDMCGGDKHPDLSTVKDADDLSEYPHPMVYRNKLRKGYKNKDDKLLDFEYISDFELDTDTFIVQFTRAVIYLASLYFIVWMTEAIVRNLFEIHGITMELSAAGLVSTAYNQSLVAHEFAMGVFLTLVVSILVWTYAKMTVRYSWDMTYYYLKWLAQTILTIVAVGMILLDKIMLKAAGSYYTKQFHNRRQELMEREREEYNSIAE